MKQQDLMAWVQGRYILEAIATCFGKNYQYPAKPYGIFETASGCSQSALESAPEDTNRQMIEAQITQVQSYFQKKNK